MTFLLIARAVAGIVAVTTFAFLFLHDSWRADNIFLVPDLILCALLLVGAVLPGERARSVLLLGFGLGAGVFATSVASYVARGELGLPSLIGAVACGGAALLLVRVRAIAATVPAAR